MRTLWQDLRYGARMLLKQPGFTFAAALTLALGVGANSAIFSVVNAALLRALPYPAPHRLVRVDHGRATEDPNRPLVWSYPKYELLRREQRIFSQLAGYAGSPTNIAGDGEPERLEGELITGDYFALLGIRPRAGRLFSADELLDPDGLTFGFARRV